MWKIGKEKINSEENDYYNDYNNFTIINRAH